MGLDYCLDPNDSNAVLSGAAHSAVSTDIGVVFNRDCRLHVSTNLLVTFYVVVTVVLLTFIS